MKQLLIIAYHFPPLAGGSGWLRSLKYCRYLPQHGWQPSVLTVHPRAYERCELSQLSQIPEGLKVVRAFGLDARRHLSFRGKYFRWSALPDRWSSWLLDAIPQGLSMIRKKQIDAIYSTFPIATAVLIGWVLHRISKKPWVVDFRDSMTEDRHPADPVTRRLYRWIERKAVNDAPRIIFTASSAKRMYLKRYPSLPETNCCVIPNGYDEEDFAELPAVEQKTLEFGRPLRLVHSGLLYPIERDPRPFFEALSRLKQEGKLDPACLRIDFRASGNDAIYSEMVRQKNISDLVHFLPALPYRESLKDAAQADGLLLFQAACCDHQIPAKVYEYLRIGLPILALTTTSGDTGTLLTQTGGAMIVDLANQDAIRLALPDFIRSVAAGEHERPDLRMARRFSRSGQAKELAACLDEIVQDRGNVKSDQENPIAPTG